MITINDESLVGLKFGESAKESVWWIKAWQSLVMSHYWYKKIKFLVIED